LDFGGEFVISILVNNTLPQIEQELIYMLNGVLKKVLGKGTAKMGLRIVDDMILVKASGILSNQEKLILKGGEGPSLIRMYKEKALQAGQEIIYREIADLFAVVYPTGTYFDLNVEKDEAIIVINLSDNLESKLKHR
ncbi:MAG: Na-translocating system protein MpsC family protein, partial [Bacillota bacterium]